MSIAGGGCQRCNQHCRLAYDRINQERSGHELRIT
jgi:hypothetical protein